MTGKTRSNPGKAAEAVIAAPSPAVMDVDQLARAGRSEWLLTNGLGGFAMGTACGVPERRYHGWLVAALNPPVGRVMALHSCVEWLVVERRGAEGTRLERHELSSFRFAGETAHPSGQQHLARFEVGVQWCRWAYEFGDITVTRELTLERDENAVMVRYRVTGLPGRAWLEVRPLVAMRDFHGLLGEGPGYRTWFTAGVCEVTAPAGRLRVTMARDTVAPAVFASDVQWWRRFEYARDLERGQDGHEDLFSPGVFVLECDHAHDPASEVVLRASVAGVPAEDEPARFDEAVQEARERVCTVREGAPVRVLAGLPEVGALLAAADQFVVRRMPRTPGEAPFTSIIAGYPWFSDWGRDTFISMRGLLLSTGRFEEALRVLRAFAGMQRRGLIPNCFDNHGNAEYNTVDASLWFVHAACEYRRVSGDAAGFAGVREACLSVVQAYREGTDFDIRVDADGLVAAGSVGTQLTWMDARRDGVVFTPRHGKAVEINALWYSGLLELAGAVEDDLPRRARELRQQAERAGESFRGAFWNEGAGRLNDVITPTREGWKPDERLRPNQVFAVSQPHSALTPDQQRMVVESARRGLLTPVGLRTLGREEPGYTARYEGSMHARDAAYHNGTVWPWLIGPYAEAVLRAGGFSEESRRGAREAVAPLLAELCGRRTPGPLRQLAEVYDAEDAPTPRRPEGCMAQAWSVAEVLRALVLAEDGRGGTRP